jgi:hypothetical protein
MEHRRHLSLLPTIRDNHTHLEKKKMEIKKKFGFSVKKKIVSANKKLSLEQDAARRKNLSFEFLSP